MNFIEIFNEPGLYVAESFAEGVAFSVTKEGDLVRVEYWSKNSVSFSSYDPSLTKSIVNKDYVRVYTRQQLFGEKRKELFKSK